MNNEPKSNTEPLKHICFFNSNKVWGGGEKWHLGTALLMKDRNFVVTVFTQTGSELFNRIRKSGVSALGIKVSNKSFLNPLKVVRLIGIFRKLHTQVIILNLPSDVKFAGIAARLAGVKKIIYRRGSPVPVRNTFLNRFLFRHVLTHIIANSDQIKRNILLLNPKLVPDHKISVIYNGVDGSPSMQGNSIRGTASQMQGVIIGTAGRLSQEKGQLWLIGMAADLRAKGLDFKLLIAGEGPERASLEQKCLDLGLTECIRFKGFVAEMEEFYSSIDLFVLTSAWEGCSNVILEAMHQGLPVVAFNNSSIPEMVKDNVSGFLVKNNDSKDLVEKVEMLVRDSEMRASFGEAGKRIVHEKYNPKNSFDQLTLLIRNV